jgi:hypothetical protein
LTSFLYSFWSKLSGPRVTLHKFSFLKTLLQVSRSLFSFEPSQCNAQLQIWCMEEQWKVYDSCLFVFYINFLLVSKYLCLFHVQILLHTTAITINARLRNMLLIWPFYITCDSFHCSLQQNCHNFTSPIDSNSHHL